MAEGYTKISNGESGGDIRTKLNAIQRRHTPRSPLFTVRFDNALSDVHSSWYPYMANKGLVASTCVKTSRIGDAGNLTPSQLLELETNGWEIMSYGHTDVDWRNITNSQIDDEIINSYNTLDGLGVNVKNIVPPQYSGEVIYGRQKCREYYRSAGTGYTVGITENANPPALDLYNLCCIRGDISGDYICTDPNGITALKALIDNAETNKLWMIYFVHQWDQSIQDGLDEVLDYVTSKGIDIVTYDTALDTFEPYLFVGRSFGVSEDSVMINQAHGNALWIDDSATHVGVDAGENSKGLGNTLIGHWAGRQSAITGSTCVGSESGYFTDGASNSTYLGYRSGYESTAAGCVFTGNSAGKDNTGFGAVGSGYQSLQDNTGVYAIGVGYQAGKENEGGYTTFLGLQAGNGNVGHYAIGIGNSACLNNTEESRFEIKNSEANSIPIIYGNMSSQDVVFGCPDGAAADDYLENNTGHFYLDENTNTLNVKVKYSDGTIKTGIVANLA